MKVRKAIIPAAGLGTRLLPNTKSIPKEMLPLVDKPVLQYIVEEAVAAGVEEILIITNRGKSPIEDYFDYAPDLEQRLIADGKRKEARTVREVADMADVYFLRQKETRGLGHAIWRAKSFVWSTPPRPIAAAPSLCGSFRGRRSASTPLSNSRSSFRIASTVSAT